MISNIISNYERERYRIKDKEKALVFQEVCTIPDLTRKTIASKRGMRPTTVSMIVQELIDDGLIFEGRIKAPGKPGRPEFYLQPNYNRCSVIVIYIQARELIGLLINLGNQILVEKSLFVPGDTSKKTFIHYFLNLIKALREAVPQGSELLGVGISLTGTVDPTAKTWISSARWRKFRNLNFTELEKTLGLTIIPRRSLDTELEYLIEQNPSYRVGNIILFHWGYGIGSAYGHAGKVLGSTIGRFGEIGHLCICPSLGKQCQCGAYGCLETEAAMWSLLPEIRKRYPEVHEDEWELAELLKNQDALELPVIRKALEYVTTGLVNLYRLFYPDRILLIGPFTENKEIATKLAGSFKESIEDFARNRVVIEEIHDGFRGCVFGSTYPFIREKLRNLLLVHTR
ncbi:MAG TPA: ROK family protein [Spirochaetia bacterium]|nr:ROK family protein [Spirochaetia bacterium]